MPDLPKLGKYQLIEHIAKGGMADVYRARASGIAGFERIVAIKRIQSRLAGEQRFVQSFIDEARIAASLNHRNIVQVVDFGQADGALYLAMELIDGVDLRGVLRRAAERDDPVQTVLGHYILAEVAGGLDYAHSKKNTIRNAMNSVVHCDISPQNIMLSFEGFVKVLDFGIARAEFVGTPSEKRLRGKPRYMSPEQTRGEVPTPATDVFALGIVAWELLTGLKLFEGADIKQILLAVRNSRAPSVSSLNPEVAPDVSEAIARALDKDAAKRGTAADLANVFARHTRPLASTTLDQELAAWLGRLFDRVRHTTDISEVRAPSEGYASDEPTEVSKFPPSITQVLATDDIVVVAVRIAGGTHATRAELRRSLSVLAFKRGASIFPRGDLTAVFSQNQETVLDIDADDDTTRACGFATDAVELARSAAPPGEPELELSIAAIHGIDTAHQDSSTRVDDLIHGAQDLAHSIEPGRTIVAGPLGTQAPQYFSFDDLPRQDVAGGPMDLRELQRRA